MAVKAYSASRLALRPRPTADHRSRSGYRVAGVVIGVIGLMGVMVAAAAGIVAGLLADDPGREGTRRALIDWAFGVNAAGLTVAKLGIVTVLAGILIRLWLRVESVKSALPSLKPEPRDAASSIAAAAIDTRHGRVTVTPEAPRPLFVHRMARTMWLPSTAMGFMAVAAGLVLSIIQATVVGERPNLERDLGAWVQGLQFLGEGFVLAGISFVLGTILGSLRAGGGEVQEHVGVPVKTLRMPLTAKLFVAVMMFAMMGAIFQFVVYLIATTINDPRSFEAFVAWLTPVRESALGFFLVGITLALATIAHVLSFQFIRIREIVTAGR